MNLLQIIKYIAVASPFLANYCAYTQTMNDTINQLGVTVAEPSTFIVKKSRIAFLDSSRVAHDLINDSLLAKFHSISKDTGFSYISDVNIRIQNNKKTFQMGTLINSFDTLISHLTKEYFLNYKFKLPQTDGRKKHIIVIYLYYDTDRKFLKFEMKELSRKRFLLIYLKKIPFW